jgi:glycolate oxidase FAD binding subunit
MAAERRPAETRDAILGVSPRLAFSPASLAESAETMAQAAREKLRLTFVGGGTTLGLGRAPTALDAAVRTERMARILDYAPSDMVLAAEAGTTLAQIQAATREHRQMLALDAPHPERATIGGLVATGAFGPRRARYGGVRDLIIGVALVRADGAVAHGGGKVVKNVAGFDLPKAVCGSLGTLGLIATATFRLHPLPEATGAALVGDVTATDVVALLGKVRKAQLEPTRMVALREGGGKLEVAFGFEGFGKGVEQQLRRLAELAGAEILADEASAAFWKRHDHTRGAGSLRVKLASLPSRFPQVDALVGPILDALRPGSFVWYAALGLGFVGGDVADPGGATRALGAAREALIAGGGSLVVEAAPAPVRAAIDPWGPVPNSFPIMAAMKHRFDPEGRLNPGRFVGGL